MTKVALSLSGVDRELDLDLGAANNWTHEPTEYLREPEAWRLEAAWIRDGVEWAGSLDRYLGQAWLIEEGDPGYVPTNLWDAYQKYVLDCEDADLDPVSWEAYAELDEIVYAEYDDELEIDECP